MLDPSGVRPKHSTARYERRSLDDIHFVVVHHTAARRTAPWEAVACYHVGHEDWPGIAYHIGVQQRERGVTVSLLNRPETRSYHAHTPRATAMAWPWSWRGIFV